MLPKKIGIVLMVLALLTIASADTERGPNWERETKDGTHYTAKIYPHEKFIKDENGTYRKFTDAVHVTYSGDQLYIQWQDSFLILEPYTKKKNKPKKKLKDEKDFEKEFKIDRHKDKSKYHFAIKLKKIKKQIDKFGFDITTFKLNGSDYSVNGTSVYIKHKIKIDFADILENNFSLHINKSNIIMGDITDKIKNRTLYIDPVVSFNMTLLGADPKHCTVRNDTPDTAYCEDMGVVGTTTGAIYRLFFRYNLTKKLVGVSSVNSAKLFLNATFPLAAGGNQGVNRNVSLYNCSNDSWSGATWNNQPNNTCSHIEDNNISYDGNVHLHNWTIPNGWIYNELIGDGFSSFMLRNKDEFPGDGKTTAFDVFESAYYVNYLEVDYTYSDPTITANITPVKPYKSDGNGLICNFSVSAGDTILANVTWFNNSVQYNGADNDSIGVVNNGWNQSVLGASNLTLEDNWTCQVTAWINGTAKVNSTNSTNNVTVDEYPSINITSPTDGSIVNNADINVQYVANDNSDVTYCELFGNLSSANFVFEKNDTTVTPGGAESFSTTTMVTEGNKTIGVRCKDDNIGFNWSENTTFKYETTTTVPSGGAGGGGGGGGGATTTTLPPWEIKPRVMTREGPTPEPAILKNSESKTYFLSSNLDNETTVVFEIEDEEFPLNGEFTTSSVDSLSIYPSNVITLVPGQRNVEVKIIANFHPHLTGFVNATVEVSGADRIEEIPVTLNTEKGSGEEISWWGQVLFVGNLMGQNIYLQRWHGAVILSMLISTGLFSQWFIGRGRRGVAI